MKKNIFRSVAVFLLVVATLLGYYKYQEKNRTSKLQLSIDNPIKSFDPAVAFNDDSLTLIGQTLETLYQYHYLKRPFEVIPLLADGMPKILKKGKLYRIKIKKNILYHSSKFLPIGRTVKAEDFVWAIKRLAFKPVKSTGAWLFKDKVIGFNSFSKKAKDSFENFKDINIEGVRAIDDYTLEIELNRPEPNLLYFLSMTFTTPTPIELIEKVENDFSRTLVGTGAYKFDGMKEGEYYFSKYKDFHDEYYPSSGDRYANTEKLLRSSKKKLPFIDKVQFTVVGDDAERWKLFKGGGLDIITIPKKYLNKIADPNSETSIEFQKKEILIKHFSKQTSRWLGFNMNDALVGKNRKLRQAIAHGVDFEKYIELLTNNTNLQANSLLNPSIKGYRPNHKIAYEYNLEKAKTYLKESALDLSQIDLTYSTRGKEAQHKLEASFLKSELAKLGINLKINYLNFSNFLKKGRAGELQFWTDNWIYDYPDAENVLQLLISKNHPGINKSGYSNIEVDDLYDRLSKSSDYEERTKIMYKIETIMETDLPWIMLMYESIYIAHHKNVQNYRKSSFIRNSLKYLEN